MMTNDFAAGAASMTNDLLLSQSCGATRCVIAVPQAPSHLSYAISMRVLGQKWLKTRMDIA
jgi:hypothetical protein